MLHCLLRKSGSQTMLDKDEQSADVTGSKFDHVSDYYYYFYY